MVAPEAGPPGTGAAVDDAPSTELERALREVVVADPGPRRSRRPVWHARDRGHPAEPLVVLARELARSRRYGHSLTLIGTVPAAGMDEAAAAVGEIRRRVRALDTVWASRTEIFILSPESGADDGAALLARLRDAAPVELDPASTHVAVFPADALTAHALIEVARGRMAPALVEPPALQERPRRRLAPEPFGAADGAA